MLPDKSVLLEQIQTVIEKKSCKKGNAYDDNIASGDYTKLTAELSDKKNLLYTQNFESIKNLEQRIKSLEDQNDRLLYFIHFLYENFPDLVRNILPPANSEIKEVEAKVIPMKSQETVKNCDPYLTRREVEILQLLVKGLCAKEIASTLFICETTVITHKKNLKEKFAAKNTVELISKALTILFKSNIPAL